MSLYSCTEKSISQEKKQSKLHLVDFQLDDSTKVSVLAQIIDNPSRDIIVRNGDEHVVLSSISPGVYGVPVFGGSWLGEWAGNTFSGAWIDSLRPSEYRVPITISPLEISHSKLKRAKKNTIWDTDLGRLVLTQQGDSAWGTFLTSTGDYRFLAGTFRENSITLGNFDGIHLFYFKATIKEDSLINGVFKSGTHYSTEWSGVRALTENVSWSSEQTWASDEEIKLSGINSSGKEVVWTPDSLINSKHKLLVVDIMGTWCPNCVDEARLLSELATEYPEMQVLSIAFERSTGEVALRRLKNFKSSLNLPWEVWLGGVASKAEADESLAFLGGVKSFPTTAFIPQNGSPIIHTGFSGPATGSAYKDEQAFFRKTIERMIKEQ